MVRLCVHLRVRHLNMTVLFVAPILSSDLILVSGLNERISYFVICEVGSASFKVLCCQKRLLIKKAIDCFCICRREVIYYCTVKSMKLYKKLHTKYCMSRDITVKKTFKMKTTTTTWWFNMMMGTLFLMWYCCRTEMCS